MELERIKDENATTQFIVAVAQGKENDVITQILEYFKTLGIELTKNQMPRYFGGQVKLKTTQEHAKHLATWLEDPRIQGRNQDEMYVVENENPWLGGAQVGSRVHYSVPAVDKSGRAVPSMFVHPEEIAGQTSKLIKLFHAENKKHKSADGADNAENFEIFVKKQLDALEYPSESDSKKEFDDARYKVALLQAVIKNIRVKKVNDLEKPLVIEPHKRKSLVGSIRPRKKEQTVLQGAQAEK